MKLLIDILGFFACGGIGLAGGYLLRMAQETKKEEPINEDITNCKNIEYNEDSLFRNLKKSNEKLGFIFGAPGAGNGYIYKNEIFEAFVGTNDVVFTIDEGDSKTVAKKLGGIILDKCDIQTKLDTADNYRLINFDIASKDEKVVEVMFDYINKRAENSPVTLLIREFHLIANNPVLFAKFKNLFEQNNIKAILEDFSLSDLCENEDVTDFISKSKNFILLTQSPMDRKIIEEKLEISDELLENIKNAEPGFGLIIHNGNIEKYRTKIDRTSALYLLYTSHPDEII